MQADMQMKAGNGRKMDAQAAQREGSRVMQEDAG
jgi:hypothetical protein